MQIQSLIGQLIPGGKSGGCKSCGGGLNILKKLLSGIFGGGGSSCGKGCSGGGCAGCGGRNCARCKRLGF